MREREALCFVICVCMRVFWDFRGKCNEGKGVCVLWLFFCFEEDKEDDWWGHTLNNGQWSANLNTFFLKKKKNLFNEENSYRILIQLIDFLKSNFHALKECKKL